MKCGLMKREGGRKRWSDEGRQFKINAILGAQGRTLGRLSRQTKSSLNREEFVIIYIYFWILKLISLDQ